MRQKHSALITGVLIFIVSCASKPPVDLGIHNPENNPEEDLITLYINGLCKVEQIDYYEVEPLKSNNIDKIIKINPGTHTFFTKFINERAGFYTNFPMPVTANFEKGNMYYLDFKIESVKDGYIVLFHIYLYNDEKTGKEVTGEPLENLTAILTLYSSNVISPPNQGKSVKLENNKYTLVFMPEGVYTQTDKESGITVKGKYVHTDFDLINNPFLISFMGKVFLFNADAEVTRRGTMGRREELNPEAANTILYLINASETEVVYRYEKPSELKGTQITFNIIKSK